MQLNEAEQHATLLNFQRNTKSITMHNIARHNIAKQKEHNPAQYNKTAQLGLLTQAIQYQATQHNKTGKALCFIIVTAKLRIFRLIDLLHKPAQLIGAEY